MGKNVIWNTVGSLLYYFCQWVMTVLIYHMTEDFVIPGIFSLAMTLTNSFATVILFGMRNYQISDTKGEYEDGTYIFSRMISVAIACVLCLCLTIFGNYTTSQKICINLFMLIRISEGFADVMHGVFQKNVRFDVIGKSYILRAILSIAAFAGGFMITRNLPVTLGIMGVVNILCILLYDTRYVWKMTAGRVVVPGRKVFTLFASCFSVMIYNFLLNGVATITRNEMDALLGTEKYGIYATISAPAVVVQLMASFIFAPFVPFFARAYHDHDRKRYFRLLNTTTAVFAFMSAVVTVAVMVLGDWGLKLLFKEEILEYSYLLLPMIWCTLCVGAIWVYSGILIALRKMKTILAGMIISFGICLVILRPCLLRFDMNGGNIVQLISFGLYVIYLLAACYRAGKDF